MRQNRSTWDQQAFGGSFPETGQGHCVHAFWPRGYSLTENTSHAAGSQGRQMSFRKALENTDWRQKHAFQYLPVSFAILFRFLQRSQQDYNPASSARARTHACRDFYKSLECCCNTNHQKFPWTRDTVSVGLVNRSHHPEGFLKK